MSANPYDNPAQAAVRRAIAAQKKQDPLIGIKVGAKEMVGWMFNVLRNPKGVHVESLLCALGALGGYACQAGVRTEHVLINRQPENKVFIIVGTGDGKNYYYGDLLNKPLLEDTYSIWSMAGGAAQQLGAQTLVDIHEIVKHVTSTVGTPAFGVPRVPGQHRPGMLPIEILKALWPKAMPILKEYCDGPGQWPLLCAAAIQQAMLMSKGALDPLTALALVMESAIPMSKVDLQRA